MKQVGKSLTCLGLAGIGVVLVTGCVGVRRELTVESQPAGALVYLNGDEIGRTPLTKDFVYYGTLDLKLRKDGYQTLEDRPQVWSPFWQVPPIDLVAEALSLTDRHKLSYELTPKEQNADPQALVARAVQLRGRLQGSEVTPKVESKAAQMAE